VKQMSRGKQRDTENGPPQVEVVPDAMPGAPLHPREQMKRFAEDQTPNSEQLYKRGGKSFL
jgi:hypothetical protein